MAILSKPGPIEREWDGFRRSVVPSDAPREQIEDVQRAFYAGWQSAITTLSTEVSPGDDLTDSDRSLMARISDELEAFWGALEDEP